MNLTVQQRLHKLWPTYKIIIISHLTRWSAVNFMKLLIPIIRLLLPVFKALDQFLRLGHMEKFRFPNIPENITVDIFRVKLAIILRSSHTWLSFMWQISLVISHCYFTTGQLTQQPVTTIIKQHTTDKWYLPDKIMTLYIRQWIQCERWNLVWKQRIAVPTNSTAVTWLYEVGTERFLYVFYPDNF